MKLRSYTISQGRDRAPARAMLKAIGFTDADLAKPIIGVANTWIETMPCNYNLRELAVHVKEGIRAAGGTPMEFNTVAISDGVTMGTEGMKTSLISREVIADSMELVARGHMFDGVVALVACDKTIPSVAATAGSTNAVLHLLAMAWEAQLPLTIDDFEPILARTPVIVDIKPGGKYMAADVDKAGGIPVIARRLLEAKYVDGTALTVTGRTFAEEAAEAVETPGQE